VVPGETSLGGSEGVAAMAGQGGAAGLGIGEKRAEIYTYEAPWLIYAVNWSVRARPTTHPFRVCGIPLGAKKTALSAQGNICALLCCGGSPRLASYQGGSLQRRWGRSLHTLARALKRTRELRVRGDGVYFSRRE
jgi:hypothetical protein